MDAAFEANYTLSEWERESVPNKARVIAHILHKRMREGYTMEQAKEKAESGSTEGGSGGDGKGKGQSGDLGHLESMIASIKAGKNYNIPGVEFVYAPATDKTAGTSE